jgi:hypothetical protein
MEIGAYNKSLEKYRCCTYSKIIKENVPENINIIKLKIKKYY